VGFFTVLTGRHTDGGRVLAVEPTPSVRARLRRNIDRNAIAHSVVIYDGAASNFDGEVELHFIEGLEEYSSIGMMYHPAIATLEHLTARVPASRIDTLVKLNSLRPGLMKVDVEGMEHVVFEGALNTLEIHRPVVISELSEPLLLKNGGSSRAVIEMFYSLRYRVFDPVHPGIAAGTRQFGDILCIPDEIRVAG
jgi:FkbM family methyltransferase